MNEQEWLECADPQQMLDFIGSRATERKLRLFAAACCSAIHRLMPEERWRRGIEFVEQIVDGSKTPQEAAEQLWAIGEVLSLSEIGSFGLLAIKIAGDDPEFATEHSPQFVAWLTGDLINDAVYRSEQEKLPWFRRIFRGQRVRFHKTIQVIERQKQALFVKEIFGNPFHPITINPAWLHWNDGTVRRIAQSIYDKKAFDRMPILADALEDAGCDNADILNHCRSDSPHVKGCWALDLVLGLS